MEVDQHYQSEELATFWAKLAMHILSLLVRKDLHIVPVTLYLRQTQNHTEAI